MSDRSSSAPSRTPALLVLLLALLIGWNFWLPTAHRYFSRVQPEIGRPNWDFFAYYIAGRAFDRGLDPYRDQTAADPGLTDERKPGFSRYIYPPTLLPLYRVFGRLDYNPARYLWTLFYLAVYLAGIGLLVRLCRQDLRLAFAAGTALLLACCHPLLVHVGLGQIDAFVGGLILLSFGAHAAGRRDLSALVLALAALTKVNPAFLLLYFVVARRDLRYLGVFAAGAATLVLASLVVVPLELYLEYVRVVIPDIGAGARSQYNQSVFKLVGFFGLLPKIGPPVAFALCGWLLWRQAPEPERSPLVGRDATTRDCRVFLLTMLAVLLFSPICWMMNYVWVVPLIALLLAEGLGRALDRVLLGLGAGAWLTSAMVQELPVLDSLNLLGGLTTAGVLLWAIRR